VALLLERMEGARDRRASFRSVVALVADGTELWAEGALSGRIVRAPRGSGGFGYDPVFELDSGVTLAELSPDEKNRLSHRARALNALLARLAN
jgi:XTP/dITP diphosphohydrolase